MKGTEVGQVWSRDVDNLRHQTTGGKGVYGFGGKGERRGESKKAGVD